MGKKSITKRLIAMLLVSVMLLSGVAVRYVTQDTDNSVDSIAVTNDFTGDTSGAVELVKNVTDMAPTQPSSMEDDGGNNVSNIVTENANGISEEFARTSSFTPGVEPEKTSSPDDNITDSEVQTEVDSKGQAEADNSTQSDTNSNMQVKADNSTQSDNNDAQVKADNSTQSDNNDAQVKADNSIQSDNNDAQVKADNSTQSDNNDAQAEADNSTQSDNNNAQAEADSNVAANTDNSTPAEADNSTQTKTDSAAPAEGNGIQTDANVNIGILLADASVKNSMGEETEETKEVANTRLVQDPEEETISEILAETMPQKEDIVDFMVVLDKEPLLAVFSSDEIKENTSEVAAYRSEQEQIIDEVEAALKAAFGSEEGFSLGYDYTLSSTSISVRTKYSNKAAIEQMAGVKTVYVSPTFGMATVVEEMDSGIYTNNAPGMIGATELNETGYTGKGMKIAIIDTGIVVDHPSFQALPQNKLTRDSITEDFVDQIWESLNAGKSTSLRNAAYHNSKLPFIFNYYGRNFDVSHETANHDHGTHVAGIAAANKISSSSVVGIAPDAQIIVMQVFNPSGGADWSTIMAALEDCVTLGVDTVNLSLGAAAGFTDGDLEMKAVLDRFDNTDTNIIIAGGNDTNNAYMNLTGTDMSKTKDIDNGLIGSPATASRALAVASADNDGADLPYFTVNNDKIGFSDSAISVHTNFLDKFEGEELDFVVIDGIGDIGDYANIDVTDKIVVVSRGKISFQEKQKVAKEKGAKALVVFNNIPGSFSMAISDGDGHIPCVAISKSDGEKLKALSTGKLTVCRAGELTNVKVDRAMSSFSSWGVTPDLKLKPEISGVGGNIYASRDPLLGGSNYGTMSGTSMASPQVAGAITVLSQYLKTTYGTKYQDKNLRILATNLLMSTASQIQEGETVYSPRYQGAGLVDLTKATAAGAYLSSTSAYENRPKGEMGDDDGKQGVFRFGFTITNLTNEQKTYTFNSTVLTPDVDETGKFMTNTTRALEAKVAVKQGTETKSTILVPANSSIELNAEITLTNNDKNFINNNFKNGTYVEGYLYAVESKQDGVTLSMPFLGFFGDWSAAPVFDEEGENASLQSPSIRTRKSRLGQNPYIAGGKGGDLYNAISETNPLEEMVFGMMRNSKKVTQTVTSKDGTTQYFTLDEENIIKTYYNVAYGMIIPYILFNYNEEVYIWDGTNKGAVLPDNTTATYTLSSYLDDGDDEVDDTYSFDVTIDNTSPVIENANNLSAAIIKDKTKGTVKLPLSITENHYVAAVMFEGIDGAVLGKFEVNNTPGQTLQTEFDVTGYGTDFTIIVADYACNETEVDVSLDLSDMPTTQAEPKDLDSDRIYGNETYSDGYVSMGWFSAKKEDFTDLKNETFDAANRVYSGEYINGYVIAQRASDGALMLLTPYNTYWHTKVVWKQEAEKVGTDGFIVFYDMAMNYDTDKLYALGWTYKGDNDGDSKDDGHNALFEIKLEENISVEEIAQIQGLGDGIDALTLGCTTEGQMYTISTEGDLYKLSLQGTLDRIGTTDFVDEPNYSGVNVIQSMCYDHEGKAMYWYAHSQTYHAGNYINVGAVYKVNLEDASLTKVGGSGSSGYVALFIPTTQRVDNVQFRIEPTGIEITPSEVKMAKGQTRRMSVEWKPWNALPGTVEWKSENEQIAEVNSNGVIKAVDTGETNVIASTTIKGEKKEYTAKVTVIDSSDGLYGFVIRDYNGKVADQSWITYSDSDLKNVTKIGSGGLIAGGTYYEGYVYFVVGDAEPFGPTNTMFYKSKVTPGDTPSETRLGSPELISTIENIEVGNIAFDYSTGRMYGVDYTNGGLCLLDVETGSIDLIGTFNGDLSAAIMPAMCVTAKGNVIGSDMFGNLYHINPDNMNATNIGSIGHNSWFYAGMTYDHNTGNIYWNPCMEEGESDLYLVQIDDNNVNISTTEIINLGGVAGDKGMEQTAMFIIPLDEPETKYIQAKSIQITNGNGADLVGLIGGTMQLTTQTDPPRPSTYAREWSSSNEEVVSVDQFGKLTFKKEGTATITVTVRNKGNNPSPPSCTDTVNVAVYPAAGEFVAFLASDEGATAYFDFWMTMKDYDPQHSEVGVSMIGTYSLRTGEYYDGYFYAYNDEDILYRINENNHEDYVTIGNGGLEPENRVISMAFDYSTGTMYGVTLYKDEGGTGKLVKINLSNGTVTEVAQLAENISAIAIDGDGRMYGVGSEMIYSNSYLYQINKSDGTCTRMETILRPADEGGVDWTGDNYISERMYSSQMTYDYNTDRLYLHATIRHKTFASRSYGLYMIQMKEEGDSKAVDFIAHLGKPALQLRGNVKVGDMYLGLLCSVPDADDVVSDTVTGIRMNRESARVAVGDTTQLSVTVSPAGATDKTVTWSTENPDIATVDENGLVTGVAAGTTIIKATSNSNNEVVATCELTVLERTEGQAVSTAYTISAKQEALISFDPDLPATTAKRIAELSGGRNVVGMDLKDDKNIYYLVEGGGGPWPQLFVYNLDTKRSTSRGYLSVFIGGASDIAYDPENQLLYVVSGFYVFQFEEKRLGSDLVDYAGYLDTTKADMPLSQMHAITCKDGMIYFIGSNNGATLYKMDDRFKNLEEVRTVDVNTVSGSCEMTYDTNTNRFYLTDAGERLYSFDENGGEVTAIDILGKGWDFNGLAINAEGAPDMPALPEIPDQPEQPVAPEINASDIITEEVTQGEVINLTDNIKNLPEGASVEVIENVTSETVGNFTGKVRVTFENGATREVSIPVIVKEAGGESVAPEIPASDIIKEEVMQGGKVDLTDNIKNLPEGAVVEVVENVTSDKVGNFTGKVKVTFENGAIREVEIPVEIKKLAAPEIPASNIIKEEVTQGGKIDLTDNIKNLPEGATVKVITNVSSDKVGSFTGKVRVTFENGTTRDVEIPVVVKAAAVKPKPWPFTDVEEIAGHWKYENIKYVYENDIMNGIAGTTLFQPDHPLTRAMFATVIYRMAGEPEVAFKDTFPDVKDGKYYSKAIIWANQQDIVQGFGDGTFGVEKHITREQIAKMLYEYADNRGYDVSGATPLDTFTDVKEVNSWAINYMKWAVHTGMITGKPNDEANTSFRLDPKGEATRAECAKMLTMFMKEYQK